MEKSVLPEKQEGKLRAIAGGAISLTVSTVIVKLLGLVYKLPLARILGDEGLGYFSAAYAVFSFFYVVSVSGIPKAVSILCAEQKELPENKYKVLNVSMRFALAVGGTLSAVLMLFATPVAFFVGNPLCAKSLVAIAPSILLVSVCGTLRGFLTAEEKLYHIAFSSITEGAFRLLLGLWFAVASAARGEGIESVAASAVLGITLSTLAGLIVLLCAFPWKKRIFLAPTATEKRSITKSLLKISFPLTCAAAVVSLSGIIDLSLIMNRLTAAGLSPAAASALYGNYSTMTVPILGLSSALLNPFAVSALPVLSAAFSKKEEEAFLSSAKQTCALFAFLSAPCAVGAYLYSGEVLSLLFPDAGATVSAPLLKTLSPAFLMIGCLLSSNLLLEACGKLSVPLFSHLIGAAVKAAVSFYLISLPTVGIVGAPLGTVAGYAASLVVSLVSLSKNRSVGFAPLFSVFRPLLCALAAICPTKFLAVLLKNRLAPDLLTVLILVCSAFLYLTFSYFLLPTTVFEGKIRRKYPKKAFSI